MNTHSPKISNLWFFFALTFGWTWFFWIAAVLSGMGVDKFPVQVLIALGGIGPVVSAIVPHTLSMTGELSAITGGG